MSELTKKLKRAGRYAGNACIGIGVAAQVIILIDAWDNCGTFGNGIDKETICKIDTSLIGISEPAYDITG